MDAPVDRLEVSAYRIPTVAPESDGTAQWDHTTLVVVEASADGSAGLGYTYADTACARFIEEVLRAHVVGRKAMGIASLMVNMLEAVRNHGREGVAAMAISAVDAALWDLKAKLVGLPLMKLLGCARDEVECYGSGGFTSLSLKDLQAHMAHWVERGMRRVKMKVGREPDKDVERVRAVRKVIGPSVELFVDGNGAYDRKTALRMAEAFAQSGVRWFEEPVSSDDLEGLRSLRERAPPGMDVTAGEYGYNPQYFRRMLEAQAVDVLMADGTRCLGVSGLLSAASLCDAFMVPLSTHCAPSLHLHPCCALQRFRHMEYFFDHDRIESMLFEGKVEPVNGALRPDLSRVGIGLELKRREAAKYAVRW